jgi:hypothetical protein
LQLGRLVQRCQGTAMVATLKKGCAASMVAGCDAVADGTCWTELTDLYDNYFAACEDVAGWEWFEPCSSSASGVTRPPFWVNVAVRATKLSAANTIKLSARATAFLFCDAVHLPRQA